jgi:hypothetical protein
MMLGNSRGGTWPAAFAGGAMRIAEGFETACAYRQITGGKRAPALACETSAASPLVTASSRSFCCPTMIAKGAGSAIGRHGPAVCRLALRH